MSLKRSRDSSEYKSKGVSYKQDHGLTCTNDMLVSLQSIGARQRRPADIVSRWPQSQRHNSPLIARSGG